MTPDPARTTDADGQTPGPGQIICDRCDLVAEPFDETEKGQPLCRDCAMEDELRDTY